MKSYIYTIILNDSLYIGRTKVDRIKARMQEHGNPPFWAILEIVDSQETNKAECKWMEYFESLGVELLNKTRASNGCHHQTNEARNYLSRIQKNKVVSEETRRKMSAWQKGIPKNYSKETYEQLKEKGRLNGKRAWKGMTAEQRSEKVKSRTITDKLLESIKHARIFRNNKTLEERKVIGQKIKATNLSRYGEDYFRNLSEAGIKAIQERTGF